MTTRNKKINAPEFSVLMAVYKNDSPKYFKEAFESILNQTLQPKEIVLVRDGVVSVKLENTIKALVANQKIPIKLVALQKNVGLGRALSIGMKEISCDYVARMDSDDVSIPDRFKIQMEYIEKNPGASVYGSYITEFVEGEYNTILKKVPLTNTEIRKYSKYRNPINHVTAVFKKSDIEDAGGYMDMNSYEDYFLWLRVARLGFVMNNIPISLVMVRTGRPMIGRRIGLHILKNDYEFFKQIRKLKFIGNMTFIINMFIRIVVRMMPIRFAGFTYYLLRKF